MRPVVAAPFWRMMTRYCGFPKLEYQILISRSPFARVLLARGLSPAVSVAASLPSKIASETGPVSFEAIKAGVCCAKDELGIASRIEAARVRRLMSGGRFKQPKSHNFRPHPQKLPNQLVLQELRCGKGLFLRGCVHQDGHNDCSCLP